MAYLYLLLNVGSVLVPFLFSFHPKLQFYKKWKPLVISIAITMLLFIPWDIVFTKNGIWGFNEAYHLNNKIFGLPIEEWLFFICIPYACVFTHYALLHYFPNIKIGTTLNRLISWSLICSLFILGIIHYDKWYTLIDFTLGAIMTLIVFNSNFELLRSYYLTFLVMLIPFIIVNGILTGSLIDNEVVWYNNSENLGIRIFTIPVEDSVYAFSLILMNLFLLEAFTSKKAKQNS